MSARRHPLVVVYWFGSVFLFSGPAADAQPTVWTGSAVSFSKPGSADPTLAENQDRLTDNVWITRGGAASGGIFNIAPGEETSYDLGQFESPTDTEWATGVVPANDGLDITAENYEALTFTTWAISYGGQGVLIDNILDENAVVHLISDDIYLDLQFTNFNSSGDFAYDRSSPVPAPMPTGDYNGNGLVDAADYTVWRDTLGQAVATAGDGADGDADGTVGMGDYQFWKDRFGNVVNATSVTPGAASVVVPEPNLLRLIAAALLVFPWAGRSRSPLANDRTEEDAR